MGIVHDGDIPVEGASIFVSLDGGGAGGFVFSDANGSFEVTDLPFGQYSVSAFASDYPTPPSQSVTVDETNPVATVDVALVPWPSGTSSIVGTITDATTNEPIFGASVDVNGLDVAYSAMRTTNEAGEFSLLNLPAGSFSIEFTATGYASLDETVTVTADQSLTVNGSLRSANSSITGHVQDEFGNPVEGLYILAVFDEHNSANQEATTDASGDYEITGLGAGAHTLFFGGTGTPYVAQARSVVAVENTAVVLNITVEHRTTSAIGGVVFAQGHGVAGICVTLYDVKRNPVGSTTSALDATYTVDGLKPGTYTVQFIDCDGTAPNYESTYLGGSKNFNKATLVTVTAGVDSLSNDVALELEKVKKPKNGK